MLTILHARRRTLLFVALNVVLFFTAGCSGPEPPEAEQDLGRLVEVMEPQRMAQGPEDYIADISSSEFHVLYGETIEPRTFRARLNGKDVTAAFTPQPKRFERVDLRDDLRLGRNELVFEAAPRHLDGRGGHKREYRVALNREAKLPQPPNAPWSGGGAVGAPAGTALWRVGRKHET